MRNKVEEVVTQRKLLWKVIYVLSTKAMEEKGDQEKENPIVIGEKEDTTKENDDVVEENAQGAHDTQVTSTNPPHVEQESATIEDIPNNSTQNVNPLSEEDIKSLQ